MADLRDIYVLEVLMSARRTNMHRLQELVRLHRAGVSDRESCRLLTMGRNTARRYRSAIAAAGLMDGPVDQLPEVDELLAAVAHLAAERPVQEVSSVEPWGVYIVEQVEAGVGAKAIYDWLKLEHADFDGTYDAVKRYCRRVRKRKPPRPEDVAIPVETGPGEVAQVDFFYVGKLFDPARREARKVWAFVMILAHSRHMFVDLVFDQRAETWQRLHAAAFAWFGGVPEVIVPDNLKAAVIRAAFTSSGDVALNRSYMELARHYGFKIDPAPPRAPKKKGKVERTGRYFRDNYMKPRDFADIDEARAGIRPWLEGVAGQRNHGSTGRRPLEVFRAVEQAALRALPPMPFAPVVWQEAKVHVDSHIQFRSQLFSVPWQLVGQKVWIRADAESLTALTQEGQRVATHRRTGQVRTTNPAHLPAEREQWRHRDRAYWEHRAGVLGEEVLTYISELFEADDVLLQLRKVQAIVTFLAAFPPERRAAACRRASFYGVTSVRGFKDILRKQLDLEPLPGELVPSFGTLTAPRFARPPAAIHPTTPTPEAK